MKEVPIEQMTEAFFEGGADEEDDREDHAEEEDCEYTPSELEVFVLEDPLLAGLKLLMLHFPSCLHHININIIAISIAFFHQHIPSLDTTPQYSQSSTQRTAIIMTYPTPTTSAADDGATSFRFPDLPAEMKNRVYEELLVMPSDTDDNQNRHCYPQILSASKEINNDAKGLLYSDNTLNCDFTTSFDERFRNLISTIPTILEIKLHNKTNTPQEYEFSEHIIEMCCIPAHSFFRKIANLNININIEAEELPDGIFQNSLLWFASSLMDNHSLKKVKITYTCDYDPILPGVAAETLYSLRRLRNIPQVEVTGDVTAELATSIKNDMQSTEPAINTLRRARQMRANCEAQFEFLDRHHFQLAMPFGIMVKLWSTIDWLEMFDEEAYIHLLIDEKNEAYWQRQMDILERDLPSMEELEVMRRALCFFQWGHEADEDFFDDI